MLTLIATFIILGIAILIHELGHLIAALLTGVEVERFSLGFGPMVVKKRIRGIDFGLAPIPFGGYVKIRGKDGIFSQEPERRFPILFMGPLFNIGSAPIIIIAIFLLFGLKVTPTRRIEVKGDLPGLKTGDEILAINDRPVEYWDDIALMLEKRGKKRIRFQREGIVQEVSVEGESLGIEPLIPPVIGMVKKGGPADQAGLREGDTVVALDGEPISSWREMATIIRRRPKEKVVLRIRRGEPLEVTVVPARITLPDTVIGQIGVMARFEVIRPGPLESIEMGINRFVDLFLFTGNFLIRLITMKESVRNLGGPIAIARVSGESLSWGLDTLLFFLAFIMINLGIINLLPLPILDGGSIVLSLYEMLRRRRVSRNFLLVWQQIGFSIFIVLAILVTFNDLTR